MKKPPILVCLGSGGTGKTTSACALAIHHALLKKRTIVLTIDPSERLKTLLRLQENGKIITVDEPRFSGYLDALLIDPKKTFDQFIKDSVPSPAKVESIIKNNLYRQLSTQLSGSQDFTALETLYQVSQSGEYDIIVLDTPPADHAIEFLKAPQKLHSLFNEGITSWFRADRPQGILKNILNSGTQKILQTLELITGSQFIHELKDFFTHISEWQTQLESRTSEMHDLLTSNQTHFWLITNLDKPRLNESELLIKELRKGGYLLTGIIVNRAYPNWLPQLSEAQLKEENAELAKYYRELWTYFSDKSELIKKFSETHRTMKVPDLERSPNTFDDLIFLANIISEGGFK